MADVNLLPKTKTRSKTERPKLYKVILLNDDYTPQDLVVHILAQVFRLSEDQAVPVMLTAHAKGACVVASFTQEVAETKASQAMDIASEHGSPLSFKTEPDE